MALWTSPVTLLLCVLHLGLHLHRLHQSDVSLTSIMALPSVNSTVGRSSKSLDQHLAPPSTGSSLASPTVNFSLAL
ncbi:hypothetical protein E1301_Tti018812 [Triplophysa tibetana]|uniref:Uncharacterized protein n=1 Tax=Triplophysa tibetana TaxID=1572043 RepID=A0A5A9P3S9_9TELE|nr:hypothetical protein E1301_Tti018812 [Triplophysa tibetana]